MLYKPMPLVRVPEPFDDPDWLFELKHDGFRALAYIDGHCCRLVSRRGHIFSKWDLLCEEIAHSIREMSAVLDGEIVCLEPDGRSNFDKLLFRRDWPHFVAFESHLAPESNPNRSSISWPVGPIMLPVSRGRTSPMAA